MTRILIILLLFLNTNVIAQSLEEFIAIAKQNNYQIAISTAKHELAKERINEVGNVEQTEVSLGVFVTKPETYVGTQILYLGLNQELPWFGAEKAKKNVQRAIAKENSHDIKLSEKELTYQVKLAYYELYQKQVLASVYDDNKLILSRYEDMALASVQSNIATMDVVSRIRIQKNELHSKRFKNINYIEYLTKNFNRILQRPENEQLYITDSLNVLDLLLTNNSIENHPSLEKLSAKKDIYASELLLIKKDKAPKISIGLDYVLIDQNPNFKSASNGNDIFMPKVSLALPLLNYQRFSSHENQILLKEKIVEYEIDNQKNLLKIELEKANLELENAIITVVAAQKNKEETQRAIDLLMKKYQTGTLNYEKILTLQLQKIKYQILEVNGLTEAFIAKAKVEYLTE